MRNKTSPRLFFFARNYLGPERPLYPALLVLLAWISPPPPGVGCAGVYLICGCGRGCGLSACFLVVPLSRPRSFAIPGRFALRGGACCLAAPSLSFRHLPRRSVPRLRAGDAISWFFVPLALSIGGSPRFPFLRSAPLPAGRGGA